MQRFSLTLSLTVSEDAADCHFADTLKREHVAVWAGLCKVECTVGEQGKAGAGFQTCQLLFRRAYKMARFSIGYCSQQELLGAEAF